jgi:hypothetical protein
VQILRVVLAAGVVFGIAEMWLRFGDALDTTSGDARTVFAIRLLIQAVVTVLAIGFIVWLLRGALPRRRKISTDDVTPASKFPRISPPDSLRGDKRFLD